MRIIWVALAVFIEPRDTVLRAQRDALRRNGWGIAPCAPANLSTAPLSRNISKSY